MSSAHISFGNIAVRPVVPNRPIRTLENCSKCRNIHFHNNTEAPLPARTSTGSLTVDFHQLLKRSSTHWRTVWIGLTLEWLVNKPQTLQFLKLLPDVQ